MSENPNGPKMRETIEFFGTPSKGTFRKIMVVAKPDEPTFVVDSLAELTKPTMVDLVAAKQLATSIEATVFAPAPTAVKTKVHKRDRFPISSHLLGFYGMHRTNGGLRTAARRCLRALRPIAGTFDAILCTGLSGQIPAGIIAWEMNKELLVLRKTYGGSMWNTESHGNLLEGDSWNKPGLRVLILDDFVSCGSTIRKLMEQWFKNPTWTIVGVCLYGQPIGHDEKTNGDGVVRRFYTKCDGAADRLWYLIRRKQTILFDLVETREE